MPIQGDGCSDVTGPFPEAGECALLCVMERRDAAPAPPGFALQGLKTQPSSRDR